MRMEVAPRPISNTIYKSVRVRGDPSLFRSSAMWDTSSLGAALSSDRHQLDINNVNVYIKTKIPGGPNRSHSTADTETHLNHEISELRSRDTESQESNYVGMGKALLENMQIFDREMRAVNASSPSTAPGGCKFTSEKGEAARRQAVKLAEQILASTMEPRINLLVSSMQYHFCSSLKVAVDLGIAHHIPRKGSLPIRKLARLTGADPSLLVRIMRILASKYVFEETSPSEYAHTSISWIMTAPGQTHLLTHRLEEGFRSASREAEALRRNNYHEPVTNSKHGFQLAFDTDDDFWEYSVKHKPDMGTNFNDAMKVVSMNDLEMIPGLYPFESLAEDGGLLVDVGGGLGQVGRNIMSFYAGKGLKCIVQDRVAQRGMNDSEDAVTMQQHNFFDPQPIHGAAAYFFRHIFHNWPDGDCIAILRQTIPAMDQATSRILICDQVVEEENPAMSTALYDIDMMSLYGGKERTLSEWRRLLEETDSRLYISDVRSIPETPHIIEVRLR